MSERELFFAALDRDDPGERAAYLDEGCAGDAALRQRVEDLLRSHTTAGKFLDVPAVEQVADDTGGALDFLAPPQRPDSLGRLGHYEVLEVISRGGMGVVLRVFDDKLQRVVAIKALAPHLATSSAARQRFVREARAAAAVTHDNVIDIHAVEDAGLLPYLVMEFIDGLTLQEKLDRTGRLPLQEILRIGLQIAEGLGAAHRQGLVHRDIKPANILLKNGIERVKLTDFGLARAGDDASLTQSGVVAGTPMYMSPEQAQGEPVDCRSDLFSLGTVLYALCTGRPPFRAPTAVAVLKRVCEETPRAVREVNPELPPWIIDLLARLHAKDPADRFGSADEVADLLAQHLAELQHSGTPSFPTQRPHASLPQKKSALPPARRQRRRLMAAALLLALLAGVGLSEATGVTNVRGTVIRLFSPEGTLVIEVDDPDISVSLDGDELVITGAGVREIRLKPGQYQVRATRKGKVIRQELVTITKRGRKVVRVSREPTPIRRSAAETERWERAVAALPPGEQVAAVAARLKEFNPGFDGKVAHKIEENGVTQLQFSTDHVTNITPVRALSRLQILDCSGTFHREGRLADLSPLKGMPLTWLKCDDTKVIDLSPLKGMPLKNLFCSRTLVSDLSPLKGMALTELQCIDTQVSDLSPLKGMPLGRLIAEVLPLSDLSPLEGMRLTHLGLYRTQVKDLSPLKGMPLEYLNLTGLPISDLSLLEEMTTLKGVVLEEMPITDLSMLKGLRLESLRIQGTNVSDLSPLKGMPLKQLWIDFLAERDTDVLRSLKTLERINDKPAEEFWAAVWERTVAALPPAEQVAAVAVRLKELNPGFDEKVAHKIEKNRVIELRFSTDRVTNISPVRALKGLKSLDCSGTPPWKGILSDLRPLRGLPLRELECDNTLVADLSPLRGMPLTVLICGQTQVADLSPLKGMRLCFLAVQDSKVTDLAPLRGMPLTWLDLYRARGVSDLRPLQGMPLEYLNLTDLRISDLSLLAGIKALQTLIVDTTSVTDLTPLRGLELHALSIQDTRVTDLSPIRKLPLRRLRLDYRPDREEFLRSFRSLEVINDKPTADFWKAIAGK